MKRRLQERKWWLIGGMGVVLIVAVGMVGSWWLEKEKKIVSLNTWMGSYLVGGRSIEEIEDFWERYQDQCGWARLRRADKEIKVKVELDRQKMREGLLADKKGLKGLGEWLRLKWGQQKREIGWEITEKSWEELKRRVKVEFEDKGRVAQLVKQGGQWQVVDGVDGWRLDEKELQRRFDEKINRVECLANEKIEAPLKKERKELSQEERLRLVKKARWVERGEVEFWVDEELISKIKGKELARLLETDPQRGDVGEISGEKVVDYVRSLKLKVDREAKDSRFEVKQGRVVEFSPSQEGRELLVNESSLKIVRDLNGWQQVKEGERGWKKIELEVRRKKPKITTEDSNDLGIVELLGRGESFYQHSIPSRIHNIELAARRIDGVLVAPGGEFSFNQAVGEISQATGFKSAYVIKNGKTILGDGGGVCQVSTTVFRAVLKAGLPITERWAHAYRVGYYEQKSKPGFDATVYAPSKDLKFRNDTQSYILLDTWYERKKQHLVIDIYGKSDGRISRITNFQMWDVVPPPPPLYQEDPSLEKGVVKQVDWKAWGAKVSFDYLVKRGNKVIWQQKFYSDYRPWQDVFLVGTKE